MKNIILSTYLTKNSDPQRKIFVPPNNFDYISHWYTSILRLNLKAILFHDGLSAKFINKRENKNIQFLKIKIDSKYSNNDYRFFLYYNYLLKNKYDNIFMTDASDVWFKKDPFLLLSSKYKLYIGCEQDKIINNNWMMRKYCQVYGKVPISLKNKKVLNCGVIGGNYLEIINLLTLFRKQLKLVNLGQNCDMPVFNKIIYENFNNSELYFGKRLTSPYKKYLKEGDYSIFHK